MGVGNGNGNDNGNGEHGDLSEPQWRELLERWFAELNLKQDMFLQRHELDFADLKGELKTLSPRVDTLVGEVARISERVDALAGLVHTQKIKVDTLFELVNELRHGEHLMPIVEATVELRRSRELMEAALSEMQREVTAVKVVTPIGG
jgi:predicted nuclease with TOPRIM domain